MIGNELELSIVRIFNRDITGFYSINQISKKLGKSYPHIYHKVNSLVKEQVLKKVQVGRSSLCSINLDSDKAVALLSINKIKDKENFLKKKKDEKKQLSELKEIVAQYKIYTVFHHKKKFVFVLDYLNDKDSIINNYPGFSDSLFLTKSQFLERMLKELSIIHDSIIMYAFETYYELIRQNEDRLIAAWGLFSRP